MIKEPRILALMGGAHLYGQELGNIEALAALQEAGCVVHCLISDATWSQFLGPALDARGLSWTKVSFVQNYQGSGLILHVWRSFIKFSRGNFHFLSCVAKFKPTHIHAPNPMFVLSFGVGLTVVRVPLVFRAGDDPPKHNRWRRALWRFVVWRTTRFVAISKFIKASLIKRGVDADKIDLIYNYPPRRPSSIAGVSETRSDTVGLRLAFVGQIVPEKGPDVAIEAVRILRNRGHTVRLLLAGRISDWIGDEWARKLRDSILQDKLLTDCVQFLGFVDDVPGLISNCDILVAPSICPEGLGNVVMEAKLAGRAAVVFRSGGLPEMIEHGVDGYVCPEPMAMSLASTLEAYILNSDIVRSHGLSARASLEKFGYSRFSAQWLETYRTAALRRGCLRG